MATHKIINKTDKPLKYLIGRTEILLKPFGSVEVNLNRLEHIKRAAMRRALPLLAKIHKERIEVVELKPPDKDVFRLSDVEKAEAAKEKVKEET